LKSYPTLEAVLEADVDLVVEYPVTHFEYAKKVLLAETHHSRKSITTTVAEAQELAALAKSNKLKTVRFSKQKMGQ
jgi:predicted dehydrogenase